MYLIETCKSLKKHYNSDYSKDYAKYSFLEYMIHLGRFYDSLMKENDKKVLEECVLDNTNWELPVEATVLLLLKAKEKGCESQEFLVQFYSYLQAHLDDAETEKEDIDYICNKFNLT